MHDSPRNKELAGLHIDKDTKNIRDTQFIQANTVGFIRKAQISQAKIVGFIKPSRSWERLNAKLVIPLNS